MHFKTAAAAILILLPIASIAQTPAPFFQRPYDVISYNLTMDWRPVFKNHTTRFSGHNQLSVKITDTTSAIVLDAAEMVIDSVKVNGQFISTPVATADTVAIPLTQNEGQVGTQLTLDVYYTRTSNTNDGMYFYPKGLFVGFAQSGDSDFTDQNLAYTMSEPTDARKWMPCNDAPYDKANSAISIIVPQEYSAQSNGTLRSVDTNSEDGSLTFNWVSDRPIATYLMCGDASKWATWSDYYHRLSNPNDSVPIMYFVWPSDSASSDSSGRHYNARYAFRNTVKMVEEYSQLFGEYPFKQYGQVTLEPFGFGGMEHQTMTSIYRYALRGFDEDVIAHELFHQWFGDKTTCESWADIWLNEGFATFGEALWEEYEHGEAAYSARIFAAADDFFNLWYKNQGEVNNIPTYNPPLSNVFNNATTYSKPGCVLHMLRRVLNNDTLFFNTLRDYSNAFAYTTANTFQFRDFLVHRDSAASPIDLTNFINEWIFQPDYPVYQFRWYISGDNTLTLNVDQLQDSTVTEHYTMPLPFYAIHGTDTTKLVFINNARHQSFTSHLTQSIDTLIFDREAIPISKDTMIHEAVEGVSPAIASSEPLRVFPVGNALKLTYAPIVQNGAGLDIMDVLGRTVCSLKLEHGDALSVLPTSSFATGNYFAVLHDGKRMESVKFEWPQ